MRDQDWWRNPSWWREEAWKYAGLAFCVAFFVIVGRAIWLDYPLDSGEVREWIGALSGWVAAAAAVITINYVSRQTRAAERALSMEAEERRDREARAAEAISEWVNAVGSAVEQESRARPFARTFRNSYPSGPQQAIDDARLSSLEKTVLRGLADAIQRYNHTPSGGTSARDYAQMKHEVETQLGRAQTVVVSLRS